MPIMNPAQTATPTTALSRVDKSEIQSTKEQIVRLAQSEGRWHTAYLWLILLAVLLSLGVFFAQYFESREAKRRADAEAELNRLQDLQRSDMDRQVASDLREKDVKIAEANERASETGKQAETARLELAKFKEPRRLSPEQKELIAAGLKRFPDQLFSLAVHSSPEPIGLAWDIDAALKAAGWKRLPAQVSPVVFDVGGESVDPIHSSGVQAFIGPGFAMEAQNAQFSLCTALRSAGIPCTPYGDARIKTPNLILVSVGSKPQESMPKIQPTQAARPPWLTGPLPSTQVRKPDR